MKRVVFAIFCLLGTFAFSASADSFSALPKSTRFNAPKKILVSVGDLKENDKPQWRRDTCASVHAIANQVSDTAVDVTCRSFDTLNFVDSYLAQAKQDNAYHIRITRGYNGDVFVDLINWSRVHETDFTTLGWKFNDNTQNKMKKEEAMARFIANFFLYASNEEAFKAGLLVNGAAESTSIEYDQEHGKFKDKTTKADLSVYQAYSQFEAESPRKKNYLRTGIQLGVMFSAAMGVYYKNLVYNRQDFDYGFRDGLRKKATGEAILFDDNDKFANYGHVYAGVLYYQTARANGFNSLESFLVGFASSATWEVLEYHEVFSINDQILTPIGGYVMGEASYQISCALIQKGVVGKAVGYTINPMLAINHGIDKYKSGDKYASQPDCKKERWSNVSMYLGLEKGQKPYKTSSDKTYVVGLNAEVVKIDDYNKPGQASQLIYDTAMVKALVEKSGGDGAGDLKVLAQVVAAAYNNKNITMDPQGQLRGYDVILGIGTASTWNDRGGDKKSGHEDFYGTINILGATARANVFYKGYNIQAEFGFYGDFAMVKAWALNDFKAAHGGELNDQFGVIRKRGYYWGLGTTTLAALSVEKGRIKVGYEAQFSSASDIKSRHRLQEEATNPADFKDSFVSQKVYVTFRITKNLSFQLAHEINVREGSANGIAAKKGVEKRTMGNLVYLF